MHIRTGNSLNTDSWQHSDVISMPLLCRYSIASIESPSLKSATDKPVAKLSSKTETICPTQSNITDCPNILKKSMPSFLMSQDTSKTQYNGSMSNYSKLIFVLK